MTGWNANRFRLSRPVILGGAALAALAWTVPAHAARISDLSDTSVWEQAARFFTLRDPAVRYALIGSTLLGLSCGLLGSFIVVRKMALVGDALSHAVLPGVALGFLWSMSKDPWAIFVGATIAGLLGTSVVGWIKHTTRLKEDTALGMVLAGFFSVGICLITMMQDLETGNKSGLDKFLFGQAAAIGARDVVLMAAVTALSVLLIWGLYKEFLAASFDPGFARSIGMPAKWLHHLLMLLLAFSVVIALQAVGVVLVSAMLITPAAAAYLLTDRMHRMIWIAAAFGVVSSAAGAFASFLHPSLPTGPLMVLAATGLFGGAFLFGPRHGVAARWWRRRSRADRVQRENFLKAIFHVLEDSDAARGEGEVSLERLAKRRKMSEAAAKSMAQKLAGHGLATLSPDRRRLYLTPAGWEQACTVVRNHRLWELYLTHAANFPSDHVHEDAEKIEHVLGEDVVRQLERRLNYATLDPHGKPIPGLADTQGRSGAIETAAAPTGYRREQR